MVNKADFDELKGDIKKKNKQFTQEMSKIKEELQRKDDIIKSLTCRLEARSRKETTACRKKGRYNGK